MSDQIKLLRIYTDEAAYFGDHKLYAVVATRARDAQLAGATVLRAMVGFGRSAHVRRRHVLENEQSILIEIVDTDVRLRAFVDSLVDLPGLGLVTLEAVEVLRSAVSAPTAA